MKKKIYTSLCLGILCLSMMGCGSSSTTQIGSKAGTSSKTVSDVVNSQTNTVNDGNATSNTTNQDLLNMGMKEKVESFKNNYTYDDVELDLTKMTSEMVYSTVFNITNDMNSYVGKTIKINGLYAFGTSEDGKTIYDFVRIPDAAACCAQGIEFLWNDGQEPRESYPALDQEIIVSGEFETYDEDGFSYLRIKNARLENASKQ